MFLILLGGSLTFGAALLATVIYTEGAVLALRTAAQVIGWLFVLATFAGFVGLRRANFGRISAAAVTLCSGVAVLYMSYFFEWNELPRAAIRHAAAETLHIRALPVAYTMPVADKVIEPVMRPAELPAATKFPEPRRKPAASVRPVMLAANACSTVTGVESLQCARCSEKLGFAWMVCQESVRLEYCETELGDERTCPSPIPESHPG
jgi:hypothetical protein